MFNMFSKFLLRFKLCPLIQRTQVICPQMNFWGQAFFIKMSCDILRPCFMSSNVFSNFQKDWIWHCKLRPRCQKIPWVLPFNVVVFTFVWHGTCDCDHSWDLIKPSHSEKGLHPKCKYLYHVSRWSSLTRLFWCGIAGVAVYGQLVQHCPKNASTYL